MAQAELLVKIRADAASAEEAFRQVGAGLKGIENQTVRMGRSMGQARADTANLAAQFQDIGVMLAAGQSPLQLAIQQGSQISQVLGPMGARGAVKALGSAFLGLVNPVTFVTVGAIAGGATLLQWLMDTEDKAGDLGDEIDDLNGALRELKSFNSNFSFAGLVELKEQYGEVNAELLLMISRQQTALEGAARLLANRAVEALNTELSGGWLQGRRADIAETFGIEHFEDPNATFEQWRDASAAVDEVEEAIRAVRAATTDLERATAVARLADLMEKAGLTANEMYLKLVEAEGALRELNAQTQGLGGWLGAAWKGVTGIIGDMPEFVRGFAQASEEAKKLRQELELAATGHGALGRRVRNERASRQEYTSQQEAAGGGILDLIAYVEGTGADYNTTLDYGRWTGGPRDLVNMSLSDVMALQGQMLANPENRARYGNGRGSSALGRYQITRETMRDLIGWLGLDPATTQFTPDVQDAMAQELIRRRGGVSGIRGTWAGFDAKAVSDATITRALGAAPIPAVDEGVQARNDDLIASSEAAIERAEAAEKREAEAELERAQREAARVRADIATEEEAIAAKKAELDALVAAGTLRQDEATRALEDYKQELHDSNEHVREAEQLLRSLETPQETYARRVEELTALKNAEAISQADYNRALAQEAQIRDAAIAAAGDEAAGRVQEQLAGQQERLNESIALGRDLFGGMISDLRQGASGAEILANALGKVADRLIDMSLDGLFGTSGQPGPLAGLFGGLFGGGGGGFQGLNVTGTSSYGIQIPAALLSGTRASGGPVWPNAAFLVGEEGPEIFVPPGPGTIIPNHRLPSPESAAMSVAGAGGGNVHVTFSAVVDREGNIVPVVRAVSGAEAEMRVEKLRKEIPGKVNAQRNDSRKTF